VNQGGEPGHDDDGLPRVDIEIPDDARELYRDVQAYHRELRALRRHQRGFRLRAPLRAPLRRGGFILPLVAGCLVLVLMSGVALTLYSADPLFSGAPRSVASGSAGAPAGSASAGPTLSEPGSAGNSSGTATAAPSQPASTRLPGKAISVAGQPVALRTITSAALAIIPANCECATAVQHLLALARQAMVTIYLVGPPDSQADLVRLIGTPAPRKTLVATDVGNVLGSAYPAAGLTVLLVDSHGVVMVAARLGPGPDLERRLVLLRPAR
jgi:hypothetical protein